MPVGREHAGGRVRCVRCQATSLVSLLSSSTVQLKLVDPASSSSGSSTAIVLSGPDDEPVASPSAATAAAHPVAEHRRRSREHATAATQEIGDCSRRASSESASWPCCRPRSAAVSGKASRIGRARSQTEAIGRRTIRRNHRRRSSRSPNRSRSTSPTAPKNSNGSRRRPPSFTRRARAG